MSWFSLSTIRVPGIEFRLGGRHNLLCDPELLRPELQSTTGWSWRWGEQGKLLLSFMELQTTGYCREILRAWGTILTVYLLSDIS